MFFRKNGHTFGVLIDFDLAVVADVPSKNQRRTGTRPFMAIGLLLAERPIKRHYKHDAESFFWVVVYHSTRKKDVNGWGLMTNRESAEEKTHFLAVGTESFPMEGTFQAYQPIVSWLDRSSQFFLLRTTRAKDWRIDELYNTLRGFRDDQGTTLAAHLKTRKEKYAGQIAQIATPTLPTAVEKTAILAPDKAEVVEIAGEQD